MWRGFSRWRSVVECVSGMSGRWVTYAVEPPTSHENTLVIPRRRLGRFDGGMWAAEPADVAGATDRRALSSRRFNEINATLAHQFSCASACAWGFPMGFSFLQKLICIIQVN